MDETARHHDLAALVCRAQRGDRAALGELVVHVEPGVFARALKLLRNSHDAADLTQEVLLHVCERLPQLRDPRRFVGWLSCMLSRMTINWYSRRWTPASARAEMLESIAGREPAPFLHLLQEERCGEVHAGLRRLKPLDAATLHSFYFDGASIKEMSRAFDAPEGTIKRRLHVARKRLAKEILAVA